MSRPTKAYPYTGCGGKHKIPASVKTEAKKGLSMHKSGFKGGTNTGWARSKQLIECEYVSDRTIKTMKAWFARHSYTSQPGYKKCYQTKIKDYIEKNLNTIVVVLDLLQI